MFGQSLTVEVPRLDGGYNNKDAPSNIEINESPDCLNVVFDDRGAAATRFGCTHFNTSVVETGSNVIDGLGVYNNTLVAWAGGSMFRASGTTFVTIPSAQGQFASGVKVATVVYKQMLICSDGTNGPYRYHGDDNFYRLGIATPSAPTAVSNVATVAGGGPEPGTYYYGVSYANTAIVEGEMGSAAAATITNTSVVYVSSIPTASASLAAAYRYIYRASASAGPYRRVGTLSNNTVSLFTDTMGATTWAVQTRDVDDASSLPAFTTAKVHKEHIWADDSTNRSLLRYTDYGIPYISQAENFIPLANGEMYNIVAVGVQDDFVVAFKDESTWIVELTNPGDPGTYSYMKSPSNLGIVGPRALIETANGIVFAGRRNGKITGFHLLAGTKVAETSDSKLRTDSISERLEADILGLSSTYWSSIAMTTFNNSILIAVTTGSDTANKRLYWFDVNRLGSAGQPGSWAPWDGRSAQASCFSTFGSSLYAGSSLADGKVMRLLVTDQYNDDGDSIHSYWWSKQLGGDKGLDAWVKDHRRLNIWYSLLGNWYMTVRYRAGGDQGDGSYQNLNLSPGGATFGTSTFGGAYFGGAGDTESQLNLGQLQSRRVQVGFTNSGVSGATDCAFKVYSFKEHSNLRRVY